MSMIQEIWDEVSITTTPRFKESDITGSEWRTSVLIQVKWKGNVILQKVVGDIDYATRWLVYAISNEDIRYDMIKEKRKVTGKTYCSQPGCQKQSAFGPYQMVKRRRNDGSEILKDSLLYNERFFFCGIHHERGNSDLEDKEVNYVKAQRQGLFCATTVNDSI